MKDDFWAHETAEVHKDARIGKGTKIWHNSQILKDARIGEQCTIGHNCLIGEGAILGNGVKIQTNTDVWNKVTLEDYVFVGPSAVFTNDLTPRAKYPKPKEKWLPTLVREGATIGANATVVCGSIIGKWAFIGAGAVVRGVIPDYAIVAGVPAKIIGWMCECGNRIAFREGKAACDNCGREYLKKRNQVKKAK